MQYGYSAADISERLRDNRRVEAECSVCGAEWELSAKERADLALALGVV
jgi:hypothetical protein